MHFRNSTSPLGPAVCGAEYGGRTSSPAEVTCVFCKDSATYANATNEDPVMPVHFRRSTSDRITVCGVVSNNDGVLVTTYQGTVTCFACRNSASFITASITNTRHPMLLRDIMAESKEIQVLARGVGQPTLHTPPYMNDEDDGVFRFHGTHSDIHGEMEVIPMTTGNVEFEIRDTDSGKGMIFNLSHLDRMDLVRALLHDFHYSLEQGGPNDDQA